MAYRKTSNKRVMVGNIREVSGEVNIAAGDIIKNIKTIHQRALTVAEEAARARKLEGSQLAHGVSELARNLTARLSQDIESESPYKGLLPYSLNEAEIFQGRNKATKDLLNCIKQGPLTVLHAESGAGKSSLLQAGIAAQVIASGHLSIQLRPHDADPVDFIKRVFLPELSQTPAFADASLCEFLRQVCGVLGPKVTLYLLFDQFEEFFNLLEREERKPFLESLAVCLNDPGLKVRWILALRAEALSNMAELETFGIAPFKNMYRLNCLSRDEAREAIIQPARRYNIFFEPLLIEHILDSLTIHGEVTPTQLQLVCSALTDDLPVSQMLTLSHYIENEGGTEGILRDYLRRQLEHLPYAEQPLAWKVLRTLITADRLRALKTHDEIMGELNVSGASREQVNLVLARLVERRLLVTRPATLAGFELAHDYLLKEIELDPQEQARKAAQELLDQETRSFRRHQTLLTPERLALIEPYQDALYFSNESQELLNASRKAVQHEQRARERRRTITIAITSTVAITMSLLALWGFRSSNEAQDQTDIARSRELAALARTKSDSQPDLSLLLSIAAFRQDDNYQTQSVLLDSLQNVSNASRYLSGQTTSPDRLVFSHAGKLFVSSGCSKFDGPFCIELEIIVWDVVTGLPIGPPLYLPDTSDGSARYYFSPDDHFVYIYMGNNYAFGEGILYRLDLAKIPSGEDFSSATPVSDLGRSFDVGSTGTTLAKVENDGSISLHDASTHSQIGELRTAVNMGEITHLVFGLDDKNLLVGSCLNQDTEGHCLQSQIILWDLTSHMLIQGPTAIPGEILGVSPHGKILAVSAVGNHIDFVDVANQRVIGQLDPSAFNTAVQAVLFSPDQETVAIALENDLILLWDMAASRQLVEPLEGGFLTGMAFSPDGQILATTQGGRIIFWNSNGGSPLVKMLPGGTGQIEGIGFTPDGILHSVTGDEVQQWDVATGSIMGKPLNIPGIYSVFDSKGTIVASILENGDTSIHNLLTGELINQLQTRFTDNPRLVFSPNGDRIASAACEEVVCRIYTSVQLWDVSSSHVDSLLDSHDEAITSLAFSPDGEILAMGYCPETYGAFCADFQIQLLDTRTLKPIRELPIGYVHLYSDEYVLAFNHVGDTLASVQFGQIYLWDLETGRILGEPLPVSPYDLVFSPDDRWIASVGYSIEQDADSLILWDVTSRQQIGRPWKIGPFDRVHMEFDPHGKVLATSRCTDDSCEQGTLILIDIDPESWAEKACALAGRNFTRAEWEFYIPYKSYPSTKNDAICQQWPLEPEITTTSLPTLTLPYGSTPIP